MILFTCVFEQIKVTCQWELEKVSDCLVRRNSSFLHVNPMEHITIVTVATHMRSCE